MPRLTPLRVAKIRANHVNPNQLRTDHVTGRVVVCDLFMLLSGPHGRVYLMDLVRGEIMDDYFADYLQFEVADDVRRVVLTRFR